MLTKLAPAEGLVMPLEDVLSRLRAPDEDGSDIDAMVRAATARFEQRTGRVMLPTQFEYRAWGWCDLDIPVVPLRLINEVDYIDADNTEQTLDPSDWYYDSDDRFARLRFVDGFVGPALSGRGDRPVIVRLEAGYDDPVASGSGDDPSLIHNQMDVQAILMLVGHWYAVRETVRIGQTVADVPAGFEDLVAERRIYR
jgi:uncharacterized phiE125 gp8 family phage protein